MKQKKLKHTKFYADKYLRSKIGRARRKWMPLKGLGWLERHV